MKTLSIKTLGCKLNQYESSLISGQFVENGWILKPFGEEVDVVIINTCTVTDRSDKKCRNYIRQGSKFSRIGKVLVTGCLAEREMNYLKTMPEVFAVCGNSEKDNLLEIIKKNDDFFERYNNTFSSNIIESEKEEHISRNNAFPKPAARTRGLIKIQDGCDGACSYCIVPNVRGLPVSRDKRDIIRHAKILIDSGCPEIVLTGITIGKYFHNKSELSDIVEEMIRIEGDFRIRITSIEPSHVSEKLLYLLKSPKVCPHLHIPIQSGSDDVLKAMNRPYSVFDFMTIIEKARSITPDISIGTDIIIGFPCETKLDFSNSLKIAREAEFSYIHQFIFSPRSGTPAASIQKNYTSLELGARAEEMRSLSLELGLKYRTKFLGRTLKSVLERKKSREGYKALSDNYIKIILDPEFDRAKMGQLVDVLLTDVESGKILGKIV